jgi:hypothetical protein
MAQAIILYLFATNATTKQKIDAILLAKDNFMSKSDWHCQELLIDLSLMIDWHFLELFIKHDESNLMSTL